MKMLASKNTFIPDDPALPEQSPVPSAASQPPAGSSAPAPQQRQGGSSGRERGNIGSPPGESAGPRTSPALPPPARADDRPSAETGSSSSSSTSASASPPYTDLDMYIALLYILVKFAGVKPAPRAKARGFGESPFGDSPSSPPRF